MFDLKRAMADWRQDMLAHGVNQAEALEELETHLRAVFEQNVAAGVGPQEAFDLAAEQLGRSADLAAEFQKLHPPGWMPTKIAAALILLALGGMFALLWSRVRNGGMDLLLACHVFSITIGYFSTLVFGGLAVCYVCQRRTRGFPIAREGLLTRAARWFTGFAAVLTAVGIGLGALWAKEHLGRYWGWDFKEIGGLAVLCWLLLELAAQARGVGVHTTMTLGTGGNIVVALAWVLVNLVEPGARRHGAALSYALFSFIALNLLLVGFQRQSRAGTRRE